MSRPLTTEERNQIKNLQVSNSIYRKKVKDNLEKITLLQTKLDVIKHQMENQLGEELAKSEFEADQVKGDVESLIGKIAYIESRIRDKEFKMDEIRNTAAREEEKVIRSWDPNDPEFQKKFAAADAELDAKIAKNKSKNKTSAKGKLVNDGGANIIDPTN